MKFGELKFGEIKRNSIANPGAATVWFAHFIFRKRCIIDEKKRFIFFIKV